jgi:hypothetical protein
MEILKTNYPLIVANESVSSLMTSNNAFTNLHKSANKIKTDEEEIAYLDELENFVMNTYCENITKIKLKKQQIERTQAFDISKVQNLPDDMIYEISTYLQPEIKYTKKFCILKRICLDNGSEWGMEHHLWNAPKKLITDLTSECRMYFADYTPAIRPKINHIRGILKYLKQLVDEKDIRLDKLLKLYDDEPYSHKHLDICYKFFLYIETFLKYRKELESKVSKNKATLKKIKNNKIVIK